MPNLPHDLTDLHLAPLALALDARIRELSELSMDDLTYAIAMEADRPAWSRDMREVGLLAAVTYLIDCQGWVISWDPRGIGISHGTHRLVLGVPQSFTQFLDSADNPSFD